MIERPIIFTDESVREILSGKKTQTRRIVRDPLKLNIRIDQPIRSDFPIGPRLSAEPGFYRAHLNPLGAVSVDRGGKLLGVKPGEFHWMSPHGIPGDRLWVREAYAVEVQSDGGQPPFNDGRPVQRYENETRGEWWEQSHYRATDPMPTLACVHKKCGEGPCISPWRTPLFMARSASRILLDIIDIRVQRLQDISEEDAIAEGMDAVPFTAEDIKEIQISDAAPFIKELAVALGPGQLTAKHAYSQRWNDINEKRGFGWSTNPFVFAITFRRVTIQ